MIHINYKSDFQAKVNIKDKDGNIIAPPSVPWEVVFADEQGKEFACKHNGGIYTHCLVDGNDIVCFVDNPCFCTGKLRCSFIQHIPSGEYCDGTLDITQPLSCDIMLWKRESDDTTPIILDAYPNWVRGEKGDDGYSPTAKVVKDGDTATITITDKNGTTTAQVHDGKGSEIDAYTKAETDVLLANKADDNVTYYDLEKQEQKEGTVAEGVLANSLGVFALGNYIEQMVVQEQGNATDKVMSQDAVTKALAGAGGGGNWELAVNETITENISRFTTQLNGYTELYIHIVYNTPTSGGTTTNPLKGVLNNESFDITAYNAFITNGAQTPTSGSKNFIIHVIAKGRLFWEITIPIESSWWQYNTSFNMTMRSNPISDDVMNNGITSLTIGPEKATTSIGIGSKILIIGRK